MKPLKDHQFLIDQSSSDKYIISSVQKLILDSVLLAPSSHNTQPWKFKVDEKQISIIPDFSRRCPVVDPDNHHLYVSLGCATENLVQAALAYGFDAVVSDTNKFTEIQSLLLPKPSIKSPLFLAIPSRQCSRSVYDGKPLSNKELDLLSKSGSGIGVQCHILTEKKSLETILDFVLRGNTQQMNDPAFVKELKSWIRFNWREAKKSGDGLYSATNGSPSIPTWIGKLGFKFLFNLKAENEKYCKQIRSSAGVAIFTSEKNEIGHWIEVGRCFERFVLNATVMGVRTALVNQPVEVPEIRDLFSSHFSLGTQRADLVVRFGRGPIAKKSMRRQLKNMIIYK